MASARLKLIGSSASPFARKVRIVLAEKRIEYTWETQNPWAADSTVPDLNPLGKVPVLVLEDGTALYDSRVICEFLDGVSPIGKLIPAGNRERIEVRRWEALADIAVGACLGWLDFRYPKLAWRDDRPDLERLAAKLADRPSFADTVPTD